MKTKEEYNRWVDSAIRTYDSDLFIFEQNKLVKNVEKFDKKAAEMIQKNMDDGKELVKYLKSRKG